MFWEIFDPFHFQHFIGLAMAEEQQRLNGANYRLHNMNSCANGRWAGQLTNGGGRLTAAADNNKQLTLASAASATFGLVAPATRIQTTPITPDKTGHSIIDNGDRRFVPSGSVTLGRRSRPFCKETVLPTALVSPQTVQITVQPPASESNPENQGSYYQMNGTAGGGSSAEDRSGRYLYPTPMDAGFQQIVDATFSSEPVVYRSKTKMASVVLPSFASLDPMSASAASQQRGFPSSSPLRHNSLSACSDNRLDQLEQRMRWLETRLSQDGSNGTSGRTTPTPSHSASMRELQSCAGAASSNGWAERRVDDYTNERIKYLQDQLEQDLDMSNVNRSWKDREIDALKRRLRELELENGVWKSRYEIVSSTPMASAQKRNSFFDAVQNIGMHNGFSNSTPLASPCFFKPSCSMGDLVAPRSPAPNEPHPSSANQNYLTPQTPPPSLSMGALETPPAPDQYVSMQRYRLLKAKSKKLLADKSEAYRTEKQEKESLLVQLQLQNKELSELRNKVYKTRKSDPDQSAQMADLKRKYQEVIRSLKNCTFASACILGVCKDVSAKKCPDYDQILGLRDSDGMTSSTLSRSMSSKLGASCFEENCSKSQESFSSLADLEQMDQFVKLCNENLTQVQKLIVDYYTNELVESIDCRLQ